LSNVLKQLSLRSRSGVEVYRQSFYELRWVLCPEIIETDFLPTLISEAISTMSLARPLQAKNLELNDDFLLVFPRSEKQTLENVHARATLDTRKKGFAGVSATNSAPAVIIQLNQLQLEQLSSSPFPAQKFAD
jgi:hypothetical protein